jgi:hypothetical protein
MQGAYGDCAIYVEVGSMIVAATVTFVSRDVRSNINPDRLIALGTYSADRNVTL